MSNSIGAVIWFDNAKGFGMLESPGGLLTFIHIKSFKTRPETIREKQVVVFAGKPDPKRQRAEATNSRLLNESKDWDLIMRFLNKEDTVLLRDGQKNADATEQKPKDPDKNKKSLMRLSALQLLKSLQAETWFTMITDYFDDRLDAEQFISYCGFLEQIMVGHAGKEAGTAYLQRLFQHFGANLDADILFNTWKSKKFSYIGYPDAGDYEIPEDVLLAFRQKIRAEELERIREYNCAATIYQALLPAKLEDPASLSEDEILIFYENLGLIDETMQKQYGPILEGLYQPKASKA